MMVDGVAMAPAHGAGEPKWVVIVVTVVVVVVVVTVADVAVVGNCGVGVCVGRSERMRQGG